MRSITLKFTAIVARGFAFRLVPIAAAATLVDGDRILVNVFPAEADQFRDSKPGVDGDVHHRSVRFRGLGNQLFELLRGEVGACPRGGHGDPEASARFSMGLRISKP
jgi:hypothetical protein